MSVGDHGEGGGGDGAAPDAVIASLKNAVMASALTGGVTRGMLPGGKRAAMVLGRRAGAAPLDHTRGDVAGGGGGGREAAPADVLARQLAIEVVAER